MRYTLMAAFIVALSRTCLAADAPRPNFLFVYTDDQRYDSLSVVQKELGDAGRFGFVKTPHADRLAAGGVRFRNAFVVNSLCSPSRANFLTGRYSHLNGVANNHTPFPADSVTWATELRKGGYTTGYFGKWHMGPQSGQRPGFDSSASFVGQGKYFDCPIEVNGKSTPSQGWVDDVTTSYAIDWIRQNKAKPFAAVVGLKSSHGPWDPPERRRKDLADAVAKPPQNADARPPYVGKMGEPARRRRGAAPASRPSDALATGNSRVEMQRNYFRTLLGVDDNLGRLLDLLDELKLADNTVVVFTSDNGYYLGEHGLGDKRSAYEESLRIPFLVRYPKLAAGGAARDEMVLNIDLAPTFLDLAGLPVPQQMQGRSLKPLLAGEQNVSWRTAWFYEYFFERGFNQIPTVLAVRTATHKLIKYPGHDDWTELFDLQADPHEKKNLYNDPAAADLRKRMEAEFEQQSRAVEFRIPDYADEKAAPAAPEPRAAAGPMLIYDFTLADNGANVKDRSPARNHGTLRGPRLGAGRDGKTAMTFDGKGHIEVPKSPSQNPAGIPLTIEATVHAGQPDGVILARGGQSHGYLLMMEGGKPAFVVAAANKTSRVQAESSVLGRWTTLKAEITAGQMLKLSIDGKPAGEAKLHAMIPTDPNDGMQIGADEKSPVVPETCPFTGQIESVRVVAGEVGK